MDHLPWRDHGREPPRIPYLCEDLTDEDICSNPANFSDWPRSRRWSVTSEQSADALAELCQKWLFFGVIRLAIEADEGQFHLQEWITTNDRPVVNTRFLIRSWQVRKKWYWVSFLRKIIDTAYQELLARVEQSSDAGSQWGQDVFWIFWATAVVLEGISSCFPSQDVADLAFRREQVASVLNAQAHIVDLVRNAGRCPTLHRRRSLTTVEMWSIISIPYVDTQSQGTSHRECVGQDCNVFNTKKDSYAMRHASSCSERGLCKQQPIDAGRLADIVSRHGTIFTRRHVWSGEQSRHELLLA